MPHGRRPDIDWLRVIATYLLFVFHVGKVFDPTPFYHLRNPEQSTVFLVLCGFIGLWHMPLFFLLAGWSAAVSFRARGARAFFGERVRRLLVPLVAGCLLLTPAIKYVELRDGLDLSAHGLRVGALHQAGFAAVIPGGLPLAPPFADPFLKFLPTFFTLERFTWSHLWFVAYLFTFTVVYAPLLAWLVRRTDRVTTPRAWLAYVPAIPLVLVQLTLRARWPGVQNLYDDWANVAYYSTFLLAGVVLACHPALERLVDREWPRALVAGTGASVVLLLGVLGVVSAPAVLLAGTAVAGWCYVVALLGIARGHLTRGGPALEYLSESAFPVYVLHQAAIVLPGYVVIGLALGIATKFALLLLLSVALTMATYHLLVRPFAVPRFLLGMKGRARPARAGRLAAATAAGVAVLVVATTTTAATWLRSPLDDDGCDVRDVQNPDPVLRDRPVVGLQLLRGVAWDTRARNGSGGTIYDPTSGRTYSCKLSLDTDDRLRLRGYIGVPWLGRTTTWTRVGSENRHCSVTHG